MRNIPNWDEFDTALDFLLALSRGTPGRELIERLFAVTNEHRTLASRLIFAVSYWISDGINFAVLAHLGNLFLVGTFIQLLAAAKENMPRLRLAAIFALVVFQLQHHENLFSSGASIDHFFVVLATVSALAALTSNARWAIPAGCGCALLATFSLAHGLLVWPAGVALLGMQRRWRAMAIWGAFAAGSCALYFHGFHFNAGHQLPSPNDLPQVLHFWLRLLGSSPALGNSAVEPWFGGLLLAATLLILLRGGRPPERLALIVAVWCLAAMGMIAWGRALLSNEWAPITSRYIILSSIAWALVLWVTLERALAYRPAQAWCAGAVLLAALVSFNVRANIAHFGSGHAFAQNAERAVVAYHRNGTFTGADASLYPDPERADALVHAVAERGIFSLPPPGELTLAEIKAAAFAGAHEIDDAEYFIEDFEHHGDELHIRGWALRPDETARLGDLWIVFRSAEAAIAFEALPRLRPDVAEALERPDAFYSGFELRLPMAKLPPGKFGIGICFDGVGAPEYMMTANSVVIPESPAIATLVGHASQ